MKKNISMLYFIHVIIIYFCDLSQLIFVEAWMELGKPSRASFGNPVRLSQNFYWICGLGGSFTIGFVDFLW